MGLYQDQCDYNKCVLGLVCDFNECVLGLVCDYNEHVLGLVCDFNKCVLDWCEIIMSEYSDQCVIYKITLHGIQQMYNDKYVLGLLCDYSKCVLG